MTSTEPARAERDPRPPARRERRRPEQTAERSPGWSLGSVAGVPVLLARSWFVIAAIITVTFAPVVAATDPGLSRAAGYALALGYAVLLGASVLVHELAHAFTARASGCPSPASS